MKRLQEMAFKTNSRCQTHEIEQNRANTRDVSDRRLTASRRASFIVSLGLIFGQIVYPLPAFARAGGPGWQRAPSQQALPDVAPTVQPAGQEPMAAAFKRLFDVLVDYRTSLPALDDLATRFGTDPEAAFAYVRDNIRTEPYVGTLRSPASVIAASGGNTQDKSELLMSLLRKMGLDARIAEAPLTEAMAARLGAANCKLALSPDDNIGLLIGLDASATARAIARAQRDYGRLLDAVPAISDAAPALAAHFGGRHYWVQYRDTDGWRDLDPSVPGMQPGEAVAKPDAVSEGGTNPHLVTVSVVTETLREGKLRETTVLTQDLVARAADEQMIQLGFMPAGAGLAGLLGDKLGAAIDLAPRLKPVLVVDFIPTLGRDFAQPGPSAAGGLNDTSAEDPVTALWLDLKSVAPEGETRTARRALIDLLPLEARRSGKISPAAIVQPQAGVRYPMALEGITQIVVANGGLDAHNHAYRMAYILKTWKENLAKVTDGTIAPEVLMWMAWTSAHGLATGAERATRDLRSQDGKSCGFSGHANVMISGIQPAGPEAFRLSIDWAIDGIDLTSGVPDPDPRDLQAMRLWNGAVRSAIETEAIVTDGNGARTTGPRRVMSTSMLLEGALTRLTPEVVAAMNSAMAQRDLDKGYLLLGAANGDPAAWWRVDPATGATDARMADLGNNSWIPGSAYLDAVKFGAESVMSERQYQVQMQLLRGEINQRQFNAAMKSMNYHKKLAAQKAGGTEDQLVRTIGFNVSTAIGAGFGLTIFIIMAVALGWRP